MPLEYQLSHFNKANPALLKRRAKDQDWRSSMLSATGPERGLTQIDCGYKDSFTSGSPLSTLSGMDDIVEVKRLGPDLNNNKNFPDKNTLALMKLVARLSHVMAAIEFNNNNGVSIKPWNPSTCLELEKTKSQLKAAASENSNFGQERPLFVAKLTPDKLRDESRRVIRASQAGQGFFRPSNMEAHQQCSEMHKDPWRR